GRQRHHPRIPGDPAREQPGVSAHVRGNHRGSPAGPGQGAHWSGRIRVSPFRSSATFTNDWKHFDFDLDDGVATVTFSRPDKLNALTFDVYADLRDLLTELSHRDEVRVLVITGTGRGF